MITLKKWNSLSAKKRRDIADIVFGDTPSYYREAASKEFHHDFSYQAKDETEIGGRMMKLMLECCYEAKNGFIKVVVMV